MSKRTLQGTSWGTQNHLPLSRWLIYNIGHIINFVGQSSKLCRCGIKTATYAKSHLGNFMADAIFNKHSSHKSYSTSLPDPYIIFSLTKTPSFLQESQIIIFISSILILCQYPAEGLLDLKQTWRLVYLPRLPVARPLLITI